MRQKFMRHNEKQGLNNTGKVKHHHANEKSEKCFNKYIMFRGEFEPSRNPLNDTEERLKSSEMWGTEISRKCFI